ncbi:MAG: GNAT family N-acetyltransferase [Cellvibrionaceae bacterium]
MPTELIVTSYQDHLDELSEVRRQVFIEEQNVPKELEWDERDALCQHILIRQDGQAVATGRIDLEKDGKVGRVAVLPAYRGSGLGEKIMDALEQIARDSQQKKLWFHAQSSAIGFYQKLGYTIVSDRFLEAGIPHQTMEKTLS